MTQSVATKECLTRNYTGRSIRGGNENSRTTLGRPWHSAFRSLRCGCWKHSLYYRILDSMLLMQQVMSGLKLTRLTRSELAPGKCKTPGFVPNDRTWAFQRDVAVNRMITHLKHAHPRDMAWLLQGLGWEMTLVEIPRGTDRKSW